MFHGGEAFIVVWDKVRWCRRVGCELGKTGGGGEVAKTTWFSGFRLGVKGMNSGSGFGGG